MRATRTGATGIVRIATRGSELALVQARLVAARIETALRVRTELVPIKTSGDRLQSVSLAKVGGKGLFVVEIEEALLDGRADIAVHSAKDLPAVLAPGLQFAAFPERADPRDALVARKRGTALLELRPGARVGTGSVRRAAQLKALRPDLEIVPLRGNVPTRLRKLDSQDLDALILACAGLERLGLAARIDERIAPELLLPAVAQGVLAVQGRVADPIAGDVAGLSDEGTSRRVAAERSFLAGLGGDCNTPLAALAEHTPAGALRLRALLSSVDGRRVARFDGESRPAEATALGAAAAESVLASGGAALLEELRAEESP
jgi:hydroxymethylbilane synthase